MSLKSMIVLLDNADGSPARLDVACSLAERHGAQSMAIPFIKGAQKTTIAIVDPKPGYQDFGDEPGADIALVIAHHCSSTGVAQALLERPIDASGDLILMGGYGHSPLRETIFDSVSRDMIQHTTIPQLLSH